jgi:signal transduction histidine kinase
MLDLIIRPAFAAIDGTIQYCNSAARQCMIPENTQVAQLLKDSEEQYRDFTGGCLYLTLWIEDQPFGASVTRMDGFDVFILDEEAEEPQLQALALAAKELRAPLSNLIIAADHLQAKGTPEMQLLEKNLYHMLRLVSNMSDAARYAQQAVPHQQLQDVPAFIAEIFEKAAMLAEQAGVNLVFANHCDTVISLMDSEKLERGIYNMLSNAIKFSNKGSRIDASLSRKGNKLFLTVTDYGRGIPSDLMGSVFSRHLRQAGMEESRHGIGLGMFMIRSAAAAHGGTVLIEKGKDAGTKLTMTLAIRKDLRGNLSSPLLRPDYAGELDHGLIELADVLPADAFQ